MHHAQKRLLATARRKINVLGSKALKILGRRVLSREETTKLLCILSTPPEIGSIGWFDGECDVLRMGVLRLNGNCLDIDYGARSAALGWTGPVIYEKQVACLWSHPWMGYYHWIIDVAPKIALFQDALGLNLENCKLCFPTSGQDFEKEVIELLRVPTEQIIDTRKYKMIHSKCAGFVRLPGWCEIQPAAKLLRERLINSSGPPVGSKIYVSRAGRRQCTNENQLRTLLEKHGFLYLEDRPRTVREQIGIFRGAKIVIAPHGAALTNLLWCEPKTKVIELFNPNYCPKYYENLAVFGGLEYHSLGIDESKFHHWSAVDENIHVNIHELNSLLELHGRD